jgi:hypothetical protein
MANFRNITFVTTHGDYQPGDGLQLEETEAAALVAEGVASYSENYTSGTSDSDAIHSMLKHDGS